MGVQRRTDRFSPNRASKFSEDLIEVHRMTSRSSAQMKRLFTEEKIVLHRRIDFGSP
jgi:hypothetical protein